MVEPQDGGQPRKPNPYVKQALDFAKMHASNPVTRQKFNFAAAAYARMMGFAWGGFFVAAGVAYWIHSRQEAKKQREAEAHGEPS
jgi:hypothetical protein